MMQGSPLARIMAMLARKQKTKPRSKTYGTMPVVEHEVWAHNAQVSTRQVRRAEARKQGLPHRRGVA